MSVEKLLSSNLVRLYLLEMIDMEYIDLEKSYITSSGTVMFKIDINKLAEDPSGTDNPKYILDNTVFDLACNYQYVMDKMVRINSNQDIECKRKILPNDEDEYYIPYVVSPISGFNSLTTITVRHKGFLMTPPDDFITETMNLFENQPEYDYCKRIIKIFSDKANEWTREQIRKKLLDGKVKGEFRQDTIVNNVYLNRRSNKTEAITYIINDWHTHYAKGSVKWTDIDNGRELVFAALNEQ